ncbi:MAG TPA: cardiolipin synthase [Opitutales bacterium]|nr:cardiolipin synthase [Opitutales bacterium]
MDLLSFLPSFLAIFHFLLVVGIALRVIMQRPDTGVALAWLFIVAAFPYTGAGIYLLLGEKRISKRREQRISNQKDDYVKLLQHIESRRMTDVPWEKHPVEAKGMNRLGVNTIGFPTVTGNSGTLFSNTEEILDAIIEDIDNAKFGVLMQFYIWHRGGKADEVLEALIRAAKRGVTCLVLIDAMGARSWWNSSQPRKLRNAGVQVLRSLPVSIFHTLFSRTDLRNHRKIVIIDGDIAWTGSMNMVDPKFFKQDGNYGEWVDAMVRLEGYAIVPLGLTMIGDWVREKGESIREVISKTHLDEIQARGTTDIQVVPSGPGETYDGLLQMLLATINYAKKELILTTPYFVPDEALLLALRGAAARGVEVHLILPEVVDSFLTRYASRSYYDDLLEVGIHIHLYRVGLLHTKSITADSNITMFGTANLDMRSLWINYEVALFVYGEEFAKEIRDLQQTYIADSDLLDPKKWAKRSMGQRVLENTCRLTSPIL